MYHDLSGYDSSGDKIPFTRDWQTLWAMFFTSTLLVLAFTTIKSPVTRLSDNKFFQVFAMFKIMQAICWMNFNFGDAGINPAIASFYIMLECFVFKAPNDSYDAF